MPMPDRRHVIVPVERPAEHPAFVAWHRSGDARVDPTRIDILKETLKTAAYRLVGCGPGGADVIATRRATETTIVEQTIYAEILPQARVLSLRLHGVVDEPKGTTWLFLDDAGEEALDLRSYSDRVLAGTWLGRLHAGLVGCSFADRLPDRGPDDALPMLRSTRSELLAMDVDPRLDEQGRRVLSDAIGRLDAVEAVWPFCLEMVADLPTTLVHGDFVGKNLRRRGDGTEPGVVPFDWDMSGWGAPIRDLAAVDLGAYLDAARPFWGDRAPDLGRLADLGRMFGLVAAIGWEVPGLQFGRTARHLARIATFHERLGSAIVGVGLSPARASGQAGSGASSSDTQRRDDLLDLDRLTRGLTSMEPRGRTRIVAVVDREPNPYRSTFPSEIVRCGFDDGVERSVFVKRYVPGLQRGDGYWDGGPYEARIHDDVLAAHELGTPAFLGTWSDPDSGDTCLALEFLDGLRLGRNEPPWLTVAARWLASLHREATPTAIRHPAIRVYDEPFFRDRARHALASFGETHPDATWIQPLIERFEDAMVPRLLSGDRVFIHGEPYPENVIVSGSRIRVVDWQSAAIGPAAIDLACLTDGPWPADLVAASVAAYVADRWPDGAPDTFASEVEAARLYWSLRWLGADVDATTARRHAAYVERLRASAERLGLVAAGA
jgi:Ser/Thr protein kinase RdoA (MazF antagonist)